MPIETSFDIAFVADLALREKQIQQNYRPYIAVHKWFARRPGTLFRALVLSEFANEPLREAFFSSNDFRGLRVADPFMGGGTPLLEANRVGCEVVGYDINPMAYWIVREELLHVDLPKYRAAVQELLRGLHAQIGHLYTTTCLQCGSDRASAKYFLWVKTQACRKCGMDVDLFPGYLVAEDRRHTENVFLCEHCHELTGVADRRAPGTCAHCGQSLRMHGVAGRNRFACPNCAAQNSYPDAEAGPPRHRMFAIEYHCPLCRRTHKGRFFKVPDASDLQWYAEAEAALATVDARYIPDEEIPPGDETTRLHRWGYRKYAEMFNARQLFGLGLSCRAIADQADTRIRHALATNLSDLVRYQNMLCRYDSSALKSLDIFSVHGFPVGLVQCESNILGIPGGMAGNIGSGGWSNITDKYIKAKAYCERPFETRTTNGRKTTVVTPGEWIGHRRVRGTETETRRVRLHCGSATEADVEPGSLDAVLTDPPYFGSVQYAELMDFCYQWLRRLVGAECPYFRKETTRDSNELTGNLTMERGLPHFAAGLSQVFAKFANALKPGRPFVFTYHHNDLNAYYPVAVAVLDAGLTCTATIPCPAEMGASIHINGTGSSVIDSVFVCRAAALASIGEQPGTPEEVAEAVASDLAQLRQAGLQVTEGDRRCISFGHIIGLVVRRLTGSWDKSLSIDDKLRRIAQMTDASDVLKAIRTRNSDGWAVSGSPSSAGTGAELAGKKAG